MRRRILAATLVITAGILAACSDNQLPTQPVSGGALKASINADGCVDPTLTLASVNLEVKGLITNLYGSESHRSSTQSMWENLKKDKLDSRPLMNHIDNLTKWTLEKLTANEAGDPDGTGILNATTGTVRLLDLVFRCAGETPTQVPNPPAGFDALFKLVTPSETNDQQFNTSFGDAAAFIPDGSLESSTLLVLVRQPETVNVNTPFPKVSKTVDVALAGGKIKPGQNLSVLFCPLETIDHDRNPRLVVAHQFQAVAATAPVGEGVEYLPPNQGGTLDCPHGVASGPQMENNPLKRGVMYAASLAGKALSLLGPKTLYAGHAAIGGLIAFDIDEGSLSPMVLVDPYVETGIFNVSIPTTTYGEAVAFSAQLRVTSVPATCGLATSPAVCTWVGQPVTQSLAGMPALTLANLTITATLDGQNQTDAINSDGNAEFSFTHINAGDDQTATLDFPPKINTPANAPHFGHSTATSLYTVNRRALSATATANEWEYGTPEPVTGTFTTSAVQYGENVTATFTTTQNALSEVDVYDDALVADVVFGGGVSAANYVVTKTNADLTIVKAPLSVTANNKTRTYGDANPTLDGSVVGIKNSDAYTTGFTTTAVALSPISPPTYPITPTITGARLVRNYNISLNNGALTITTRNISITADDASRDEGTANPSFTGTIGGGGLVGGDGVSVAYSSVATVASVPGTYPITGALVGAASGNYNASITNGTLTVVAAGPVLDQDNDPTLFMTSGCGGAGSLYQSFTPSNASLKAVELRLRAGGSFPPAGVTTTVNIRSGSPGGAIVGTATASVTGLTTGQEVLANFTFASPLAVNAGGTYVIEWVTTPDPVLTWASGSGDTYAGGNAFGCGAAAIPGQDFNFKTYR